MKVIAFDVNEVCEYCLKDDTEKSVTFSLGILDTYQWNYIRSLLAKENYALAAIELVRMGLKDWEGLKDRGDKPVQFEKESIVIPGVGKTEVITKKCLDAIRPYIDELSVELVKINQISESDSKNSDTP